MVRTKDGTEEEIDMSEKKKGEENAKTKECEEKEDYIFRERQTEEEKEGKNTIQRNEKNRRDDWEEKSAREKEMKERKKQG